ncbi:MAG: peptidoglycan-associated lipoprotein Pal [Rhodospirillales bacterium]|nr:peptidoglycan-associated lipoprotein Pal [Rhodospirillales bacterium]
MRIQSLTYLVAALFLATACAETMQDGGAGQGSGGNQQANTSGSSVKPGTGRDFVVNVGDRVFFEFDKSSLSSNARSQLEKQAAWLKKFGNISLTLEGHADERGTREYNLALGERRANSAKDFLVALGVAPNRIKIISYGKERPAALGQNEAAWRQNRRAVTVVVGGFGS